MDAVILLSNANTEVNLRRRERLKLELHPSYRHLCNPSNPITSQLFGDDLPKAVKDIAEANKISSKLHGERKPSDRRDKRQRSRSFAGQNSRTPYRPYRSNFFASGSKNYQRPPFSNRREGAKKKQQQEKNHQDKRTKMRNNKFKSPDTSSSSSSSSSPSSYSSSSSCKRCGNM
ncbi:hypothetical protein P5673_018435 [Acropora cervicornis]|uniref:Uncharacterized protein n=1 Tax=Acropora cervicornis TaxID=6130 RepID=A0AAD9QDF9_ACRCE|nr:hypothetical protein P5673_018435 [Acropora cervicornis]